MVGRLFKVAAVAEGAGFVPLGGVGGGIGTTIVGVSDLLSAGFAKTIAKITTTIIMTPITPPKIE